MVNNITRSYNLKLIIDVSFFILASIIQSSAIFAIYLLMCNAFQRRINYLKYLIFSKQSHYSHYLFIFSVLQYRQNQIQNLYNKLILAKYQSTYIINFMTMHNQVQAISINIFEEDQSLQSDCFQHTDNGYVLYCSFNQRFVHIILVDNEQLKRFGVYFEKTSKRNDRKIRQYYWMKRLAHLQQLKLSKGFIKAIQTTSTYRLELKQSILQLQQSEGGRSLQMLQKLHGKRNNLSTEQKIQIQKLSNKLLALLMSQALKSSLLDFFLQHGSQIQAIYLQKKYEQQKNLTKCAICLETVPEQYKNQKLMMIKQQSKDNKKSIDNNPTIQLFNNIFMNRSSTLLPAIKSNIDPVPQQDQIKYLICSHVFHAKCIQRWLKVKNSCPVCKTSQNQHRNIGYQFEIQEEQLLLDQSFFSFSGYQQSNYGSFQYQMMPVRRGNPFALDYIAQQNNFDSYASSQYYRFNENMNHINIRINFDSPSDQSEEEVILSNQRENNQNANIFMQARNHFVQTAHHRRPQKQRPLNRISLRSHNRRNGINNSQINYSQSKINQKLRTQRKREPKVFKKQESPLNRNNQARLTRSADRNAKKTRQQLKRSEKRTLNIKTQNLRYFQTKRTQRDRNLTNNIKKKLIKKNYIKR